MVLRMMKKREQPMPTASPRSTPSSTVEMNTTSHTNWGGEGGHVLVLEVNTTSHTNWGGGESMC